VQLLAQTEQWEKTITAADEFAKTFPQSKQVPLARYFRGVAQQKLERYDEAAATFAEIVKSAPKADITPRAQFMQGFTWLLAEDNTKGIEVFNEFLKKFPKHELAGDVEYWKAMAFSFDGKYPEARKAFADYLKNHKDGAHRDNATFRRAYCLQQMMDFPAAITELSDYLRHFPHGGNFAEANLLLGDAYLDQGSSDEGLAAWAAIPDDAKSFYEEGIFKTAKVLKLLEDEDGQLELLEKFVADHPESPRIAEAIYNIGRIHTRRGDMPKAREIYWEAIRKYGGDPSIRAVDDLFPVLAKLYRAPGEPEQYAALLRDLRSEVNPTTTLRSYWAEGAVLKKDSPEQATELFRRAAALIDPATTNPLILADIAETLQRDAKTAESEQLWRDLVKWNPRAPQKDRALFALAEIETARGNEKAALAHYDRFASEIVASGLHPRVMLARADLLTKRGQFAPARESLDALLANKYATGSQKAEALCRIGDIHMREANPTLAIPYYQRVYVMHSRWRDWVAHAYYHSGEAFEKLSDTLSARRTYQELIETADLIEHALTQKAKSRLEALGGPLPKQE